MDKRNTTATLTMEITSPAFAKGGDIPPRHTVEGDNISPPLHFSGVPEGTRSLALIMEDIDSPIGPFTHWVLWNMPPDTTEIGADTVPPNAQVGINGFGEVRYGGPCPPSGKHRYKFHLYALDTRLEATSPDHRKLIESEMEGNVIVTATLTGKYQSKG